MYISTPDPSPSALHYSCCTYQRTLPVQWSSHGYQTQALCRNRKMQHFSLWLNATYKCKRCATTGPVQKQKNVALLTLIKIYIHVYRILPGKCPCSHKRPPPIFGVPSVPTHVSVKGVQHRPCAETEKCSTPHFDWNLHVRVKRCAYQVNPCACAQRFEM